MALNINIYKIVVLLKIIVQILFVERGNGLEVLKEEQLSRQQSGKWSWRLGQKK